MKVKELVSLLSKFDPEADLNFEVGSHPNYRALCAKLVLEDDGTPERDGDGCLAYMTVVSMDQETYFYSKESEATIHLIQSYYNDEYFEEKLREFLENKKKK